MTEGAFCARDDRPLLQRIWGRIGFGRPHVPPPEDLEGWAPSYMITETETHLDWGDRLRVLVSGKVSTKTLTKTDVSVGRSSSVSAFSVLPP